MAAERGENGGIVGLGLAEAEGVCEAALVLFASRYPRQARV